MSVAAFIASQKADHGVAFATSCRALGVSQSWFFKWRDRPPTARQARRDDLDAAVAQVFVASAGTDGSPRVTVELRERGWQVGENTVADSMRRQGLVARRKKRFRSLTRADKRARKAPDLLGRDFTADAVDTKWCGDLTEIPTGEGTLYLATTLDLFSRRLLGYAVGEHHDAPLAVASLQMAAAVRGGTVRGVIFHSDQGSEYTATLFAKACRRLGIIQSMGRVGSALDNAAAESFFSTLEHELLSRRHFATKDQARREIAAWIDRYNRVRRHSTIGMRSPVDHELAALGTTEAA